MKNLDKKGGGTSLDLGKEQIILLGNKYLLSHEPVEAYMPGLVNIYGHLHDKAVNDSPNRFCCCVEQTDYKPISIIDIEKYLTKQVPF